MPEQKKPLDRKPRTAHQGPFDLKRWLDQHVVPLLTAELSLHSFFQNGSPPREVLAFILVSPGQKIQPPTRPKRGRTRSSRSRVRPKNGSDNESSSESIQIDFTDGTPSPSPPIQPELSTAATGWPSHLRRLLVEHCFCFDHLRDVQLAPVGSQLVPIFGGDGTPLYGPNGMVSARIYRREADGIGLIIQLGCQLRPLEATAAIKQFFASFDRSSPFEVIDRFKAVWGQA